MLAERRMEVGLKMVNRLSGWRDKTPKLNFEETELRLGLLGGGQGGGGQRETTRPNNNNNNNNNNNSNGKRGYSETLDLKLNISSKEKTGTDDSNEKKMKNLKQEKSLLTCSNFPAKPPAKAQVVGWPPVQSFRKNIGAIRKSESSTNNDEECSHDKVNNNASFVKVSMDGAPYLRKVDFKIYKSYQELSDALGKMFSSFTIGNCGSQGMKDFMNESKLMDLLNDSDFIPAYEDKDGDWMLVGDVPWEMFVKSCKRLRIMKGAEAIGLAPRAMEKCKTRS